jgi:class 3 adenylate cyclase
MAGKEQHRRFDLIQYAISYDDRTGVFRVVIEPDPRRYERRIIDGEEYLYDKFDNASFPAKPFMESLARFMEGTPGYFQPPHISDAATYVVARRPIIRQILAGDAQLPVTLEDKSDEFLQSLTTEKLGFVILCADLVGSTKLATTMKPDAYKRLISIVLYELSEVIPQFHGHVHKYTGDGLIAYFPEPSFITKNDLALDCGVTLRRLVYGALNPAFREHGLPAIDIRIGIDADEAYVVTIGSPKTKQAKDIIGAVVSLAMKIQALAEPGGICIGETSERNLYVAWRQICKPLELPSDWPYQAPGGSPYRVFRVQLAHHE